MKRIEIKRNTKAIRLKVYKAMLKYLEEHKGWNMGFCFTLERVLVDKHHLDIRYSLYKHYNEESNGKNFIFKELYAYKPKVFYETDYSWFPVDNPATKPKEGSTIRINILKEIITKMEKENEENKLKRRNR